MKSKEIRKVTGYEHGNSEDGQAVCSKISMK